LFILRYKSGIVVDSFKSCPGFCNYFEPRVPDGCFVNIVTDALGLPPLGTPVFTGCAMFGFAIPPWLAGFEPLPGWFFGFTGFPNAMVFPPPLK
jgi:hypothetical protein